MTLREENIHLFTPFWPLCLITLSLAVLLGWQVTAAARQHIALLRLADQQTILAGQAAQASNKLQAMMMDLLELSKTDADAQAVVSKYGIKFNPAPASTLPAVLHPALQAGPPVPSTDAMLPQPEPKLKTGSGAAPRLSPE